MITKRIIPCLDVKNGRVVKGVNFEGLQDMADPVEMARYYNASGADELVFYDITASVEGRGLFTDILRQVASQIFIPLTVGGGINTLDDFDRVLKCGADKVSVNSGAIRNPGIIPAAAQKYGNQCVVLSADIKRVDGKFMLFAKGGRENTGIDALDWLEQGVKNGAGELVVNSIDTDGVKNGFDLELLDTPGTMPPSFENQELAKHLAYIGSVNDDILDFTELAPELLEELWQRYPALLAEKYGIGEEEDTPLKKYEKVCRRRGFLLRTISARGASEKYVWSKI